MRLAQAAVPQSYVGVVEATDARLAVVLEEGSLRAYVCGGETTYASHTRWFSLVQGQPVGPQRPVQGVAQGWTIEGELGPSEGHGVLTSPEGVLRRWRVSVASEPLGLYELESELGKIGAIVQGVEPEVQGTLLGKGGFKAQVTPVRPVSLPDNLWIEVRLGQELHTLRLHPRR